MDDEDDVTAKAYASIAAHLERFTSPSLGSLLPQSQEDQEDEEDIRSSYQMDAMEWMTRELSEQPLASPGLETPKRTPLLERAGTPVMSNSKKKDDNNDEDAIMEPVQTPFRTFVSKPAVREPQTLTTTTVSSSTSSSSTSSLVDRRYHDALLNYLKAKRSLSHRMDLEQQDQQLQGSSYQPSTLANQECRTEVEFLRILHQIGITARASPHAVEANVWSLLQILRQLGLSALIWNNDSVSAGQNASAQTGFLQQLSHKIHSTPKELLEELASSKSSTPLVLRRRYEILKWMQACMDQIRFDAKPSSMAKKKVAESHPDDPAPHLVPEGQQQWLGSCLSYIMAGRMEETKAMARSNGQSWRAAAWAGGEPCGYIHKPNPRTETVDRIPTGNPNRFLWKRQVWANGKQLLQTKPEEAAIYSLLANDVQSCLSNPALRDFEKALCAIWYSTWGRIEDELLHWHNNHRRNQCRPPYPGTSYLKQETEQLLATSGLAGMTEAQVIQMLTSSAFPSMRGTGCYKSAISAFLVGKSAILEYCDMETSQIMSNDSSGDGLERLRFLTHLTLYLDSLHASTTPIILDGLTEQKNRVLSQYVQYLGSRPHLWSMLALYVSLLPEEQLLNYYPTILKQVVDGSERESILEQIRELFPNLEIHVLRKTVRLSLADKNLDDTAKCKSIQWLLHHDEHWGDALICSNILLREFFLNKDDDKMETAMFFVEEFLPEDFTEQAGQTLPAMDTLDPSTYSFKVDTARSEHLAFLSYLDAYRTFGKWKDVLSETIPNEDQMQIVDTTFLNPTETSIAQKRKVKDWIRQKRSKCETVLDAASHARTVFHNVLTHPGGWLSTDDEHPTNEDDRKRVQEIAEIRARYLVLAVNLYHEVAEDTASWMARSLDDASSIQLTRAGALQLLETPAFDPAYWYEQALDLAILVANDNYAIHTAFGSIELQEFMAKLAETAVSKLMNA